AEVAGGGALVPALGEVRRAADDVGEQGLGGQQVAALHGLDAALEDAVDLGRSRRVPHLPQRASRARRLVGVVPAQDRDRFRFGPAAGSPALTGRTWPEMLRARSLARKSAADEMSSAFTKRRSGERSSIALRTSSSVIPRTRACPAITLSMRSPSVAPGATTFTRMLCGPSSMASPKVMPTWPALAEQ